MADYTYKICSNIGLDKKRYPETFWIEEKKPFKKWKVICSGHEKFDDGKVECIKFKDYNDAEQYLLAKYSQGYGLEKDGNVYKLYLPSYYV
jgi:hypothetical protein